MAICTVCDGQEFNEIDGEYFCTVCETQNDELRVVEAEEEFVANFSFTPRIPTGPREKRTKKRVVRSRPWTCDEAFLIILDLQAKALIEAGASPRTRDVIFNLWSTTMSRVGSGFNDDSQRVILRERDKWVGNKDNPKIQSVLRRKGAQKAMGMDLEMEDESVVNMDVDELSDSSSSVEIAVEGTTPVCSRALRKSPFYMKLATTLAICQAALMYTTDLVTSADIVQWTKHGKLPYRKVIDKLPEFMELSAKDLCTFVPFRALTSRDLRRLTGRLMYRLGVTVVPSVDVGKLICRYAAELELPVAVNVLARRLFHHTNMKVREELAYWDQSLPCHEAIAMSHIVVVLCLLFGCDDVTEKKLDEIARENERSEPLFILSDWMIHIEEKLEKNRQHALPQTYDDVKTCNLKFDADIAQIQNHPDHYYAVPRRIDRLENRSALQNSLRTLLIRSEARLESRRGSDTDSLHYDTPGKDETPNDGSRRRKKNFRYCRIYHLENHESTGKTNPDSDSSMRTEEDVYDEGLDAIRPFENYALHWREADDSPKSDTFAWLLAVCSEMADCDPRDVELMKERLELAFLLGYSTPALTDLATEWRKRVVHKRFFK